MEAIENRRFYYRRNFPVNAVCSFITKHAPIVNRELTFQPNQRFKVANTTENFLLLYAHGPPEAHLGGVFTKPYTIANKDDNQYWASELNFDIDEYTPCQMCVDGTICANCWAYQMCPMMQKVFDYCRLNYEFKEFYAFYSGRRSIQGRITDQTFMYTAKEAERRLLLNRIQAETNVKLDENVFVQVGHLMRMPYSIHPKTARVCVPVNLNNPGHTPFFKFNQRVELENQLSFFR